MGRGEVAGGDEPTKEESLTGGVGAEAWGPKMSLPVIGRILSVGVGSPFIAARCLANVVFVTNFKQHGQNSLRPMVRCGSEIWSIRQKVKVGVLDQGKRGSGVGNKKTKQSIVVFVLWKRVSIIYK